MEKKTFTKYEIFIIAILTILQFTIVLDFMVLSPLGAILMPTLKITPAQFGMVVSAYAFSAGTSGLLAAGFADRFDRKKLLLFFYTGFIFGTFLCGIATDYNFLLIARTVTGVFGGVISSISFAIITDLFRMEVRGRVMGFIQMSFASSQVLGIPLGLYMANKWDWHSPFMLIVGVSIVTGILIILYMKPIDAHLQVQSQANAIVHLAKTVSNKSYLKAFAATTLLATGGFMLMPFASAFSVNNLGIPLDKLPMLYMITGIFSMASGPIIGKLSDTVGKYTVFFWGTMLSAAIVVVYCNLGVTPFWAVIIVSVIMFVGVSSRMISSSALMTAVPEPADRGAFMGVNSSIQQISGGIATFVAGLIVVQTASGKLENYSILGYTVVGTMMLTVAMMYFIHLQVTRKSQNELRKAA
ncbi:MFS transporter [Ohtaekwangia koreensis]|uniref:Predicted arabinose efflux permease, MFS family n=1 Tax=Ohtaekwangia koreensis TaxID=688867 RepID=A0A1T5MGN3_9BACT|nr:MFS transporter [Ohtaekwangia koreensis]SKC87372.1 Predicted arabinose efflux permease, MFS family [Ohtaekwangia koreensis]